MRIMTATAFNMRSFAFFATFIHLAGIKRQIRPPPHGTDAACRYPPHASPVHCPLAWQLEVVRELEEPRRAGRAISLRGKLIPNSIAPLARQVPAVGDAE